MYITCGIRISRALDHVFYCLGIVITTVQRVKFFFFQLFVTLFSIVESRHAFLYHSERYNVPQASYLQRLRFSDYAIVQLRH
jgi:hypothetical protein